MPDEDSDEEIDIGLKDFITIFKIDEISDHIIKMINAEVNSRKKAQANANWKKSLKMVARQAYLAQFENTETIEETEFDE